MFAVLEHQPPKNPPPDDAAPLNSPPAVSPPEDPAVHWDLLVEIPGQERLATWQLSENPAETDAPIPARRIADHRRIYLDHEGPLSGDRGRVRRIDRGQAEVRHICGAAGEATLELRGELLNGIFELATIGPTLIFHRTGPA